MKLKVYHCDIRGEELSPYEEHIVETKLEADRIVNQLPHISGREYFYGMLETPDGKVALDPTYNHRYNLSQNFIRLIIGERKNR
jgi:hypothetical protein